MDETGGGQRENRLKQASDVFSVTTELLSGRHFLIHIQIKCPVGYLSQSYIKYSNLFLSFVERQEMYYRTVLPYCNYIINYQ